MVSTWLWNTLVWSDEVNHANHSGEYTAWLYNLVKSCSKYIYTSSYLRESKEQLTNPLSNLAVLRNAEKNKHRMNAEMARKVEQVRLLLESKQQYELSKSDELKI